LGDEKEPGHDGQMCSSGEKGEQKMTPIKQQGDTAEREKQLDASCSANWQETKKRIKIQCLKKVGALCIKTEKDPAGTLRRKEQKPGQIHPREKKKKEVIICRGGASKKKRGTGSYPTKSGQRQRPAGGNPQSSASKQQGGDADQNEGKSETCNTP